MAAADFNADGNLDLVFFTQDDQLIVLLGNDKGAFKQVAAGFYAPNWLAVADLNGDGYPDLIGTSNGDNAFTFWLSAGIRLDPHFRLLSG